MRIEHLINDTYQVTNGDSVFYQENYLTVSYI